MEKRVRRYYEFGDYRVDVSQRELQRSGQVVPLTLKAFDVLLVLVENHGQLVEKEKLLESVWPDSFIEENNLTRNISMLRQALGDDKDKPQYIETISKRGYRFIASVKEVTGPLTSPQTKIEPQLPAGEKIADHEDISGNLSAFLSEELWSPDSVKFTLPRAEIEPVGGAVPLESKFYIDRPVDKEFRAVIARQDSIVLIKGARQMGKTSLLARGLDHARKAGNKVVLTDFYALSSNDLESAEALFLTLGNVIAEQLDLDVFPKSIWKPDISPNVNFEWYIRREVLKKMETLLVWGLDGVDRLFSCSFASEVFGLFRSWHNMRALDATGPWRHLTLAIAYATEARLFITDMNQSPFNVGTELVLNDFTIEQVKELNFRYGSPLRESAEVERFYGLVGGHPYLVQRGLYEMAHGMGLAAFESQADRDDGPLGEHLRQVLQALVKDPTLSEVLRGILQGQPCPTAESFYRLRSAGAILGDSASNVRFRCRLYANYLKRYLT
jgi:DNA-binding winged helix-turn-helix (wHTH) protein